MSQLARWLTQIKPTSLSGQINLYLSSGLIVFTLVASLVLYHAVSHALEQTLKDKAQALASQLAVVSLDSILIRDYAVIERFADELVQQSPDILYLQITSYNPRTKEPVRLAQAGDSSFRSATTAQTLVHTSPILFMDRPQGEIELVYSTRVIEQTFLQIMLLGLVGLMLLLALQFWLVKRLLASQLIAPITQLVASIHLLKVPSSDPDTASTVRLLTSNAPTELRQLDNHIKDQQIQLQNYLDELQHIQQMTHKLTERLRDGQRLATIGQMAAGLAHNLNTPLATIIGYAQILQTTSNDEAVQQRAVIIERQAFNSAEVVKSLLNASRLPKADMTQVALKPYLQRFCQLISPILKQKGLQQIEESLEDIHVTTDAGILEQVLFNLLGNAVEAGAHKIALHLTTHNKQACLQIIDDGQGIPAELQSEIFKAFVTSKPAHQGTGLGLYMAQEMLSLIQGELTLLSSQPGQTVFSLQLPYDLKEDSA